MQTVPMLWVAWVDITALWGQASVRVEAILILTAVFTLLTYLFSKRVLMRFAQNTQTKLDDILVASAHGPMWMTVLVTGLWYSVATLELGDRFDYSVRGLLLSMVVLIWFRFSWKLTDVLVNYLVEKKDLFTFIQDRTRPIFDMAFKVFAICTGLYCLLVVWGVDVTALIASAGIVGMAIGFAAQDSISTLFAGFSIMAEGPYKLGDYLVLDSGVRGRVTIIGIRSTRLLTPDGVEIILPNSTMSGATIINVSGGPNERERIQLDVGVAYGVDMKLVRQVLLDIASNCPTVVQNAPKNPKVAFASFGDSALNLKLLVWIERPEHRPGTIDALNSSIYDRFDEEGIEIPYMKAEVFLHPGEGPLPVDLRGNSKQAQATSV